VATRVTVRERCGFCASRIEIENADDWHDALTLWRREHVCQIAEDVDMTPTSGTATLESISEDERLVGFHA